jgi:hypothetical protein
MLPEAAPANQRAGHVLSKRADYRANIWWLD